MEVGAGDGATFRLKGFRHLDKKRFGTVSITSSIKQSRLSAGLQASKCMCYQVVNVFRFKQPWLIMQTILIKLSQILK